MSQEDVKIVDQLENRSLTMVQEEEKENFSMRFALNAEKKPRCLFSLAWTNPFTVATVIRKDNYF